jgi:hypothetical protein
MEKPNKGNMTEADAQKAGYRATAAAAPKKKSN